MTNDFRSEGGAAMLTDRLDERDRLDRLIDAVRAAKRFVQIETSEVFIRGWHVQAQAVRPEHEVVDHTGFVSAARLVSPAT